MELPIYQVDAFANSPFTGNPAGVCILQSPIEDRLMQLVAMEMNLAETAFVIREAEQFRLRWFTPEVEVDLCGHATLATAHLLWEEKLLRPDQVAEFQTRSGLLTATRDEDSIALDFPSQPPVETEAPDGLLDAMGVEAKFVGRNRSDFLIEVESQDQLNELAPNMGRLANVDCRGTIVTCLSDQPQYDFVSRFFAPAVGVNEDPVTGSAHCCLTPFWANKLGKNSMRAFQASRRGGELEVALIGERVKLRGRAITVLKGRLFV